MARRRTSAAAGGSIITLIALGILGYTYLPGFAPLVDRVTGWVSTQQGPQLPDAAAAGSRLASDLFDAIHHGSAAADHAGPGADGSDPTATDEQHSVLPTTDAAAPTEPPPTRDHSADDAAAQDAVVALRGLDDLPVTDPAPMAGYSRDAFGPAWTDENTTTLGRNRCDTRNDILGRDLAQITYKSGQCVVAGGVLHDPYTGADIAFTRGQDTSAAVQVDHVVSLANAWVTGAQHLSERQRIDLANDPLNLLAVSGPVNEQRSDADAADWLPPDTAYRCDYVSRQIAVKIKYDLWVAPAEHDAIAAVLAGCPDQTLPTAG